MEEMNGKCGENVAWRLVWDAKNVCTMYLTGHGSMYAYAGPEENAPWANDKDYISTVYMDDGITDLGAFIFNDCWDLTTLPNQLRSIGEGAFAGCRTLALTSLPDTVVRIEEGAFEACPYLTLKHLPPKLEYIGDQAFMDCERLKLTHKPDTLVHIGMYAFEGCLDVSFP